MRSAYKGNAASHVSITLPEPSYHRAVCSFSALPDDVSVKHGEQGLSLALQGAATDTTVQNQPPR